MVGIYYYQSHFTSNVLTYLNENFVNVIYCRIKIVLIFNTPKLIWFFDMIPNFLCIISKTDVTIQRTF